MGKWLTGAILRARIRAYNFLRDEDGDSNIIAIILIIIAVIAVAGIFKDKLIEIVNDLFDKIKEMLS